jgi:hypothetical protein
MKKRSDPALRKGPPVEEQKQVERGWLQPRPMIVVFFLFKKIDIRIFFSSKTFSMIEIASISHGLAPNRILSFGVPHGGDLVLFPGILVAEHDFRLREKTSFAGF